MSRKRYITSAAGADERIEQIACSDQLSAMMWPWFLTAFDDWGRIDVTSPGKVRLEVFPAFPKVKNATVIKAIDAYVDAGMVHRYGIGERTYLAIRPAKWMKWQTYLKGTKRASTEPPIPTPTDTPWRQEENDELIVWLTRADERELLLTKTNVGKCQLTNADNPRHSGVAVPSPSPSPTTGVINNNNSACEGDGADEFGLPAPDDAEKDFQQAAIACARAGIVISSAANEADLDRLIHDYTLLWVIAAAERTADKPPGKRHMGMLKAILKEWKVAGGIDDPGGHSAQSRASPALENAPDIRH